MASTVAAMASVTMPRILLAPYAWFGIKSGVRRFPNLKCG